MFLVILLAFILLTLSVVFVSWHLKVLCVYLVFLVLKRFLPTHNRKNYGWVAFAFFVAAFAYTYPHRISHTGDYIQSVYFNTESKKVVATPLVPYLSNIVGEGEVMTAVSLISKVSQKNTFIRSNAFEDVVNYCNTTPFFHNGFHMPYRKLAWKRTPPHNVPFQLLKGIGWYKNIDHYFLHIPEGAKDGTEVIVFCHGYAGNWVLYTELLAKYTSAIIIAVETPDFNGVFNRAVMQKILKTTLPHAFERMGLKNKKTHLIGLSTGGSAVNTSVQYFPDSFKTFTILSASLNNMPATAKKVNVIYGAKDRSGGVNSSIPASKYRKYVIPNENHSLLVSNPDSLLTIINDIIKRNK